MLSKVMIEHVRDTTYRAIWFEKDPDTGYMSVCDIIEAEARGWKQFVPNVEHEIEVGCSWEVDFGRAKRLDSRIRKIILQCPAWDEGS